MSSSISIISSVAPRDAIRASWSQNLGVKPRGLALARERGWILAWDEKDRLHLFDCAGSRQASSGLPGSLVSAATAEDGSAHAAIGAARQLWWLAPDLSRRWEEHLAHRAVAVALDAFGQYVAVAESHGGIQVFDCHGRLVCRSQSPRPLQHLAFVPAAPFILGSADYGFVGCFDLTGRCMWRDSPVANIGSMAVSGDGNSILLACFTEGLQRYNLTGQDKGRMNAGDVCRLVAISYDGELLLGAGLSNDLLLLDCQGRTLGNHEASKPAVALALSALGENAIVALADGRVIGLDVRIG